MRILIISDLHLEDRVEEKKCRFLENLFTSVDQIIINGDLWEGYLIQFSQFLDSPYRRLFPLLKKKNTIYLYGNHDAAPLSDKRISQFSTHQTHKHTLTLNGQTLQIEHGDRVSPFMKHDNRVLQMTRKPTVRFLNQVEQFMIRHLGRKSLALVHKKLNKQVKENIKSELKAGDIFVCGHTHYSEFNLKEQFINTGLVKYGVAQYLIIDNGKLYPKEEWYD